MFCLLKEPYQSGVGLLVLRLDSSADFVEIQGEGAERLIRTRGHEVTIRHLPAAGPQLPGGMQVDSVVAWAFYIRKRNAEAEQLTFSIRLRNPTPADIKSSPDTGQGLTAIELTSPTRQVHIGTPDEDYLSGRAAKNQWVPRRLAEDLNRFRLLVTTIEADGLRTQVPPLLEQEQFYFHYVVAESSRRKSAEYPAEWDISTWYAVEQEREQLEAIWRQLHPDAADQ